MASGAKRAKRGKYCICGGPRLLSCTNTYHVPGVSMHSFPKNKKKCKLWVNFVCRHRANFNPTSSSVICLAHFENSCFATRYHVGIRDELKPRARYLVKGSVPTKDTVVLEETPATSREKRTVSRMFLIHAQTQQWFALFTLY